MSFESPSSLAVSILAVRTSLRITLWASHDRTDSVAEAALMPKIEYVPEFSVDFHVRVVEVVAERRVVVLVIIIMIVADNRRFGHLPSEASIWTRAVVAHAWPCVSIARRVIHGQRRFGRLFGVATPDTSWAGRFRRSRCARLWIEVRAFGVGRWLDLVFLCSYFRLFLRF